MTKLEREALRLHEAHMSQPVSVLFPRPPRGFKQLRVCTGCGQEFWWTSKSGPERMYCTSTCKTNHQRKP